MDENIKLLKQKFEEIHSLGWIKGYSHGKCSIGATFENLIGKPCENFEIPDFNGIEIKVKGQSNEHNLCLFNCAPDSYLMEVKRLKNEYGYPDKDYPEFKVFNVGANAKYKTKIPSGYQLKLYVNYKLNIIELIVYDKHNNLIDDKTSWSFELLKEKLERKLSYLAFVDADSFLSKGTKYFYYQNITFYKLKNFNTFLKLVEKGKISIVFKVGLRKSGENFGNSYDHGTAFVINKYNLPYLFYKINS